jgi:aconitate hydratase
MNYLASPLLVVACALSGTVRIDFENEPLGISADDKPVYLRDIWPSDELIAEYSKKYVSTGFFHTQYKEALTANHNWNEMQETGGDLYQWDSNSTYIQKPPLFDNMIMNSPDNDIVSGSRVLAWFGDSVTTDHISPAGSIAADSPAGLYLQSKGISREDFNSYGSRRGNHEVMIRGTFANIRIRNRLTPEVEGGYTRYLPDDQIMTIYDASLKYMADSTPLLILAGREYGSGSSRDWAAKGTVLLGVKAVIAQSFERIHRSNLVGMGVLPLQFMDGQDALSIGLNGEETFYFPDFSQSLRAGGILQVQAVSTDGNSKEFSVLIRIDSAAEMETWRNGGILPQVLRQY